MVTRPKHGGNLNWAAKIAGCPTSSIIDFSASINPLGIPQTVQEAIAKDIPRLTAYPNPDYSELRYYLAKECNVDAKYILPGNGSAELLTWAARDLARQQVTFLIDPAFGDYYRALKAFDVKIDAVTGKLPFADLNGLISARIAANSGLLLNNPHNPTGKLWQKTEIVPYLSKFALVIIDEAFMDFLLPHQQQSLIDLVPDFDNLVILRSLTKFYSIPGLRIGYAVTHPQRIERWQQYRDPWSVNSLAATAAITAIQDRKFQQTTWDWLAPAREELFQGFSAIPGFKPLPSAANFLLVKSEMSVTLLQEKLLQQHRILIRDCLSFPSLGDRYFRVAVRTSQENRLLLQAIKVSC